MVQREPVWLLDCLDCALGVQAVGASAGGKAGSLKSSGVPSLPPSREGHQQPTMHTAAQPPAQPPPPPAADLEIIHSELRAKDVERCEGFIESLKKLRQTMTKEQKDELAAAEKVLAWLKEGKDVRFGDWSVAEVEWLNSSQVRGPVTGCCCCWLQRRLRQL